MYMWVFVKLECQHAHIQSVMVNLQYSNGEVSSGLCGEPQSEVRVRLGEDLQCLLQLLEPVDEQVTVL